MVTRDSLLLPEQYVFQLQISSRRDQALQRLVQSIQHSEPALSVLSPCAPGMHGEILDAPSLVIEDHGGIRLFEHSGNEAYSYRALLLAGDEDLAAIGVARCPEFETYCREYLGLGNPRVLTPKMAGGDDSLATCCRKDMEFVAIVATHAETYGGLNILPYMGTWPLWELAGSIADHCGVPVRVIAPPPQLTRRVNDKIWFAKLVQSICGQTAIPTAREAENFSRLCQLAIDLASTHASIAIRLPDSASSAGNLVLDAESLRGISWHALHDQLYQRLCGMGWNGGFPLQVVAWELELTSSPSVHLWIPALAQGEPMVEAIFEQHISGLAREFDGARPLRPDGDWQPGLAQQAFEIGKVLQYLGYFGRCSLDAIITGGDNESQRLHWVECNGRWGGVSLPLSLNRRLDSNRSASMPFIVCEETHQKLPKRRFDSVMRTLEPHLYRRGMREMGAVLLSPGRLLDGTGYEFMVRAEKIENAMHIAAILAALLGKKPG